MSLLSLDEGYAANLLKFLTTTFPKSIIKQHKRSWLKFGRTGTLIYVNGSKRHDRNTGWYDLDESIYNTLLSSNNSYQAIILGNPETTFVMPNNIVHDIFSDQPRINRPTRGKRERWMFSVSEKDSKYFIILGENTMISLRF